jgi:hypothetical protein
MLPLAVAIAVSPVPVLAVVLMLLSAGGRMNARAFLAGWGATLGVVVGGVALLGIGTGADGSGRGVAIAQLALAAVLLVVMAVEWHGRPRRAEPHRAPRWMALLTRCGPGQALGLGVALVLLNVKDGALTVAAGAKLADAGLAVPGAAACIVVFVLVASATVIVPIAVDLALGERATPTLGRWRTWLERHGSTAVVGTLAAVVAVLAVQGLQGL